MKNLLTSNILFLKIFLFYELFLYFLISIIKIKSSHTPTYPGKWKKTKKNNLTELRLNKSNKKIIKNKFTINDEIYPIF